MCDRIRKLDASGKVNFQKGCSLCHNVVSLDGNESYHDIRSNG